MCNLRAYELFAEDSLYVVLFNKLGDFSHFLGIGLAIGFDTFNGHLRKVVSIAEVPEGFVRYHDRALRDIGETCFEFIIERIAFSSPLIVVGTIYISSVRVGLDKSITDVTHFDFGVLRVQPDMRVGAGMVMIVIVMVTLGMFFVGMFMFVSFFRKLT